MVGIVVGVDGSAAGHDAVRWAARQAQRQHALLHLVTAYQWNWHAARFDGGEQWQRMALAEANKILAEAERVAKSAAPAVAVRGDAKVGEPAPVLLDAALPADLAVVGHRGRGGFASLLLGSVGHQIATHAAVPVVVVRGRTDAAEGPVVVGADGSPGGTHALELGFAEAAERGCDVVAVRAYHPPVAPWGPGVPPVAYDAVQLEAAEQRLLDETVAPWRDKYPQVAVRTFVAAGPAGRFLVDLSQRAQLVVVGHRGHGSLAGVLLGSVGLQLVHHADCPILVARR